MKSFKTMTLALGLTSIFALGACGSDALDDAKKFADELCACKDAECVAKVSEKAKKSLDDKAMEKLAKESPKEMEKLMGKIMECSMKHMPDMPPMPK